MQFLWLIDTIMIRFWMKDWSNEQTDGRTRTDERTNGGFNFYNTILIIFRSLNFTLFDKEQTIWILNVSISGWMNKRKNKYRNQYMKKWIYMNERLVGSQIEDNLCTMNTIIDGTAKKVEFISYDVRF